MGISVHRDDNADIFGPAVRLVHIQSAAVSGFPVMVGISDIDDIHHIDGFLLARADSPAARWL